MKKDQFYEVLDKEIEKYNKRLGYVSNYIVRIGYKYDYEKEYVIDNEYLFWDNGDYTWLNDWDEGQDDVILKGIISIDHVFDFNPYMPDLECCINCIHSVMESVTCDVLCALSDPPQSVAWNGAGKCMRYERI